MRMLRRYRSGTLVGCADRSELLRLHRLCRPHVLPHLATCTGRYSTGLDWECKRQPAGHRCRHPLRLPMTLSSTIATTQHELTWSMCRSRNVERRPNLCVFRDLCECVPRRPTPFVPAYRQTACARREHVPSHSRARTRRSRRLVRQGTPRHSGGNSPFAFLGIAP